MKKDAYIIPPPVSFNQFKPLEGKRFGKIKVLHTCGYDTNTRGEPTYEIEHVCECDCGKMFTMRSSALAQDKCHSCGCASPEDANKRKHMLQTFAEAAAANGKPVPENDMPPPEPAPTAPEPAPTRADVIDEIREAKKKKAETGQHVCERIALMEELLLEMDKPHQKAAASYLFSLARDSE